MKKWVFLALFNVCVFSSLHAFVGEGFYVRGFGGWNYMDIPKDECEGISEELRTKTGYVVGASMGYKCCWPVGFEGEFSYRENLFDQLVLSNGSNSISVPLKGNIDRYSAMGNVFVDFPVGLFSPYIGAGLGYSYESVTMALDVDRLDTPPKEPISQGPTYKELRTAYQGIIGISLQCLKKTDVRIDYRYLGANSTSVGNDTIAFTLMHTF